MGIGERARMARRALDETRLRGRWLSSMLIAVRRAASLYHSAGLCQCGATPVFRFYGRRTEKVLTSADALKQDAEYTGGTSRLVT